MLPLVLEALIKIALLIAGLMTAAAYLVLVERRIAAWIVSAAIRAPYAPNACFVSKTNVSMVSPPYIIQHLVRQSIPQIRQVSVALAASASGLRRGGAFWTSIRSGKASASFKFVKTFRGWIFEGII